MYRHSVDPRCRMQVIGQRCDARRRCSKVGVTHLSSLFKDETEMAMRCEEA